LQDGRRIDRGDPQAREIVENLGRVGESKIPIELEPVAIQRNVNGRH
jgi:hypothetical protein